MNQEQVCYPFKKLTLQSHDLLFSGLEIGDQVIVDRSIEPKHNEIVAIDDNGEIFLAKFEIINGVRGIFPPRDYSEDQLYQYLVGAVVDSIRSGHE